MNPFDFVHAAGTSKKNLMRGTENDALMEKEYNAWIVNLAFSMHPDTILQANYMNMYHEIKPRAQFEFYINSIRARKRKAPWAKSTSDEDINAICNYYNCNTTIAKQYHSLLTSEQLETIKKLQETGGLKNERSRKSNRSKTSN